MPPNEHCRSVELKKPKPSTSMRVSPPSGPLTGKIAVTRGSGEYVYVMPAPDDSTPSTLTRTPTMPPPTPTPASVPGGATQATESAPSTVAGTSASPMWQTTVVDASKPVPATDSAVPPVVGPLVGDTSRARGGSTYVNCRSSDVCSRPLTVTSTVTTPSRWGGATHVTSVDDTNDAGTTAGPMRHASAAVGRNRMPRTVITVPPKRVPIAGTTDSACGGSTNLKDKPAPPAPSAVRKLRPPSNESARPTTPGSCTGTPHSMVSASTKLASTSAPSAPKRQRMSRVLKNPSPFSVTTGVPGMSAGASAGVTDSTNGGTKTRYVACVRTKAPPDTDRNTSHRPGAAAGITAVPADGDATSTCTAALSTEASAANCRRTTVSPSTKPAPLTSTTTPPAAAPVSGVNECTAAVAMYEKVAAPSSASSQSRPFMDTENGTTSAPAPSRCGGDTHASMPADSTTAATRASPKRHTAVTAATKLTPLTRTTVPPTIGPAAGAMERTDAVGRIAKGSLSVVQSTPLLVTSTTMLAGVCGGDVHCSSSDERHVAGTSTVASAPVWPVSVAGAKRHMRSPDDTNPSPWTSTTVPPSSGPSATLNQKARGSGRYEKRVDVADQSWPFVETCTETTAAAPAGCAGASQATLSSSTTTAATRTMPNRHSTSSSSSAKAKPSPEIRTSVPPVTAPVAGAMPDTVARCVYVKRLPVAVKSAPLSETSTTTSSSSASTGFGGDTHLTAPPPAT
mmetsp:Transcript_8634/g.30625  ORF Transcript_8634/g.30625 Transcript_8634/m.30625 type:complete len:738 (+) Transcript_8634:374-2587(+)